MAAEAGGDHEPVEAGNRADHREVIRGEGLEAGPATGERAAGQRRVDGARGLEAALHALVQQLVAVGRVVGDARGPAAPDQVGTVVELLEAQPVIERAEHRRECRGRGLGQQHLERPRLERQADPERRQQPGGPRPRGDHRRVAGQAVAVSALHRDHAPVLHHEAAGPRALVHPRSEPPRRRREGAHGGHRVRLPVQRAVHAAAARQGDPGREPARRIAVHQLHRDAVGPLLRDPRRRGGPGRVVEGQAQPSAAAIAGRRFQLAVEIGPAREALEGQRPLGGIAAHHADSRRARARGRGAQGLPLQHRDPRGRIEAAQMERGAQPHEPAAHDHDPPRHAPQSSTDARRDAARAARAALPGCVPRW